MTTTIKYAYDDGFACASTVTKRGRAMPTASGAKSAWPKPSANAGS